MATLNKTIGDKQYSVSASVSSFNHICTYREVHDYKMTIKKKDGRFDRFVACNDTPTEKELKLLASMFAKNILNNGVNSDHRGIMLTLSTGNSFIWDYTMEQHKQFTPLFEVIKPDSVMPLYREDESKNYILNGVRSSDAYCELSMLNFSCATLEDHSSQFASLVSEIEAELPEPEQEQSVAPQGITEDAIRQYLNSRG